MGQQEDQCQSGQDPDLVQHLRPGQKRCGPGGKDRDSCLQGRGKATMLETAMTDVRTPVAADAIMRKNASVPEMIFFLPAPSPVLPVSLMVPRLSNLINIDCR